MKKRSNCFKGVASHVVVQFEDYHSVNPHVYELFKSFAEEMLDTGVKKYGAGAIFEQVRWHVAVTVKGDVFKMNHNYRSCYARMLMKEDRRFRSFFSTRVK
jgi:hypothetical protein